MASKLLLLFSLGLLLVTQALAQQQALQPAPVSCNARFSAPCARINSKWLATSVANQFPPSSSSLEEADILKAITSQEYNRDTGFYPFAFDRNTGVCVAHGAHPEFVGLTIQEIFHRVGITFADGNALHQRFLSANHDWVQYLWADQGRVNSKLAYVVNVTDTDYYLGVGYENEELPPDTPCQDDYDSWCSLTNVRSIVGKAQFALSQAESLEAFEQTVFRISFEDEQYKIPEGFYLFMYHFDGPLKAHGVLREDEFGKPLSEIFVDKKLGTAEQGQALHEQFVNAVSSQDSAFVQYTWRNSLDEDPYTKIAFVVKVSFGNDDYYLAAGYKFAVDDYPLAPLGESCTDDYNLGCSFGTAYQLSAHALSFAIASPLPVSQRFEAITKDSSFKHKDFYVFVYSFDNQCVAHGANEDYVGLSLNQIFEAVNINLDATQLHQKFVRAAQRGGGWVLYDWLNPTTGDEFEKISYVFQINIDGQDYYGGVGFNHQRFPVQPNAERGRKKNGKPIPCTAEFALECSETNARAILGQALAALTLGSSEASAVQAGDSLDYSFEDVLTAITTEADPLLYYNDFFVSVFSFEDNNEICATQDGSGCAVAHGGTPEFVGLTWAEILEVEGTATTLGTNLHRQLMDHSNKGGGVVIYPWQATSKRAWVGARFRHLRKSYYAVAEYYTTEMPPTCDACPSGMHCTDSEQYICADEPAQPMAKHPAFISVLVIFFLGCGGAICLFNRQKQKNLRKLREKEEEMERMACRLEQQMQGIYQIVTDLPIRDAEEYKRKIGANASDKSRRNTAARWYWEEDQQHINKHISEMRKPGTNFVSYSGEICGQIEHAFRLYQEGKGFTTLRVDLTDKITSTKSGQKIANADSGNFYEVDFEQMVQFNSKTKFERPVERDEIQLFASGSSEVYDSLPRLPDDLNFTGTSTTASTEGNEESLENLLPTFHGQIIQVSKVHSSNEWLFGNVLYDPVMDEAVKTEAYDIETDLQAVLARALHDRQTSGWFPRTVTKIADHQQMHKLLKTLGGEVSDSLAAPENWDESGGHKVVVPKGTAEYDEVTGYFKRALYGERDKFKVKTLYRIQNLPLWQSYAVKRTTMRNRYDEGMSRRFHNTVGSLDNLERRWLFHGSSSETMEKISQQGFNRSFAGRNAVAYGRGVYFARDASYSCWYSKPDENAVKHMFMCCVSVGDWSKGTHDQIAPETKPNNAFELYDSTVDNLSNPSIFVCYHDSQAYPEYLVSFEQIRT